MVPAMADTLEVGEITLSVFTLNDVDELHEIVSDPKPTRWETVVRRAFMTHAIGYSIVLSDGSSTASRGTQFDEQAGY